MNAPLEDAHAPAEAAPEAHGSASDHVTIFPRKDGPGACQGSPLVGSFVEYMRRPTPRTVDKFNLPMWSRTRFRNDYRNTENALEVHGFTFDLDVSDKEPVPALETVCAEMAGLSGFVSSSSSHTPSAPRWRLHVATDKPILALDYKRLGHYVANQFSFKAAVGRSTIEQAHAWFAPHEPQVGGYIFEVFDGAPLKLADLLREAPSLEEKATVSGASTSGSGVLYEAYKARDGELSELESGDVVRVCVRCPWEDKHTSGKRFDTSTVLLPPDAREPGDVATLGWVLCLHEHCKDKLTIEDMKSHFTKEELSCATTKVTGIDAAGVIARLVATGELARDAATPPVETPVDPAQGNNEDSIFTIHQGGWGTPPAPVEYAVHGLMPNGTVGFFLADGGSLKTWTALSLAAAYEGGKSWLGRFRTRGGKVYFVDYEADIGEAFRRAGILQIGEAPGLVYMNAGASLHDKLFWEALPKDGGLYIIDSLSEGSGAVDENSVEASLPLKFARRVARDTGAVFIFLHHTNKKGDIRGSSALRNASDFVFEFEVDGACSDITNTRQRRGKKAEPFTVMLSDKDGLQIIGDGSAPPAKNDKESENFLLYDRIVAQVRDSSELLARTTIAKRVGGKYAAVLAAIRELEAVGQLVEIERTVRLDSDQYRHLRILEVLRSGSGLPMKSTILTKRAHVLQGDLDRVKRDGAIFEQGGGYIAAHETSK